jgi:hypothetical protein
MKRVPIGELDYPGEDGLYYHEGEPFTGVSFDRDGLGLRSETEFRDGLTWGITRKWHLSGILEFEKQCVSGVWHGLCQEWDDRGRPIAYEVYELGVCVYRQRWAEGVQVEDWRLIESDNDFATLQMLRKHFLQGLAEWREQHSQASS